MARMAALRLAGLLTTLLLFAGLPVSISAQSSRPAFVAQAAAPSGWEIVDAPTSATMYALDMIDAAEGWSGGMAGFMFHYASGVWGGFPTGFDSAINAIDMLDASSGWAVTWQGEVLRYQGSSWSIHTTQAEILDDIKMVSGTDGWAVGGNGTTLHYTSGSWQAVSSPAPRQLKGVDLIAANDGWAVGLDGMAIHWNGSSWQGGTVNPQVHFTDVDMVSSTDVWAVGMQGVIYHYNGAVWSQVTSPTTAGLEAVAMVSSTSGWAVGENGTLLRYDGLSWQLVAGPTPQTLYAVYFVSPREGWAVGKAGTILHYRTPADLSTSTKVVSAHHAVAGAVLTYTITVRNTGDRAASSVVVTDPTPAGSTYELNSAHTSRGTIQGQDPLSVLVTDLEGGGEATITFRVKVNETGPTCWMVTNHALVSSGGIDLDRLASTVVGACHTSYLPLVLKVYAP